LDTDEEEEKIENDPPPKKKRRLTRGVWRVSARRAKLNEKRGAAGGSQRRKKAPKRPVVERAKPKIAASFDLVDDDCDPLPRTKTERERHTDGHTCLECESFYNQVGRPDLVKNCSRHRHRSGTKHRKRAETPPKYWALDFFREEKDS